MTWVYLTAAFLMISGLLCLYHAFRKRTEKEKIIKAFSRPLPKNYGTPFLWLFGIFCLILALLLILKPRWP